MLLTTRLADRRRIDLDTCDRNYDPCPGAAPAGGRLAHSSDDQSSGARQRPLFPGLIAPPDNEDDDDEFRNPPVPDYLDDTLPARDLPGQLLLDLLGAGGGRRAKGGAGCARP